MAGRFYVGGRVLKTTLAVGLSVYTAQLLGIERVSLAAIVAIVTIQRTFYRSLVQSAARLGSVFLGASLGTLAGLLFGASPLAFSLMIFAVIYSCLLLNWQENIVVTSVVAIGVLASRADSLTLYSAHQLASALVGSIVALLVNFMFAPHYEGNLIRSLVELEESLGSLLESLAGEILHPGCRSESFGTRVAQLKEKISAGLEHSKLFREEQYFKTAKETQADLYRETLRVFSSQNERLLEMHQLAKRMVCEVPQAIPIARLLCILKKAQRRQLYGKWNHDGLLQKVINNLEEEFSHMELPATRAEFVSRASLVHLFKETKKYYRRLLTMHPVREDRGDTGYEK